MKTSEILSFRGRCLKFFPPHNVFRGFLYLSLSFLLLASSLPSLAVNYTSVNNGDWSNAANWNPAGVPGAADNVTIAGNAIFISGNTSCKNLTLASAGTVSTFKMLDLAKLTVTQIVTVNAPSGNNSINLLEIGDGYLSAASLIINGGVGHRVSEVILENGTLEVKGNIAFNASSNAQLECSGAGAVKISGTFGSTGAVDLGTASTTTFNGTTVQQLPANILYNNIIIENTAGVQLSGPMNSTNIQGDIIIKTGKLDLNTYVLTGKSTASLTIENNASLLISGTAAFPAGYLRVNLKPLSEVIYQGSSQQIAALDYGRLTLKGSGSTKTLAGNCSVASTLVMDAGVTFGMGTSQIAGTGAAIINGYIETSHPNGISGTTGALACTGGLTLTSTSTIEYNANGNQLITPRNDYKNIIISNGGEKTISGNITIGGLLRINTGAKMNLSTFQILNSAASRGSVVIDGTIRTSRTQGITGTTQTAIHRDISPVTLGVGSTVEYNSTTSGTQIITSRSDYQNIVLTNTRGSVLQGNVTLAGNFLVKEGAYLRLDNFQVREATGAAATMEILGKVGLTQASGLYGSAVTAIHSNVQLLPLGLNSNIMYDALGPQNVTPLNYGGLTIDGEDVKTAMGNFTIQKFILVDGVAILDMGNYQISPNFVPGIKPYIAVNGWFRTARSQGFCGTPNTTIEGGITDIRLNTNSTIFYYGINQLVSGRNDYGNVVLEGGNTKTLDGTSVINTSLDLYGGSLDIGNYSLTLEAPAVIYNYTPSTYIIQSGTGRLFQKNIGAGIDGKSWEVIFPVGTPLSYTPLFITNSGPNNIFSVVVSDGISSNHGQLDSARAVQKTWDVNLETNNGTPDVTLRVQWNAADEAIDFDRNNCAMAHFFGGGWRWASPFGPANGFGPYSATATNVTHFSPFGVANGIVPLPVELVSFKATKVPAGALLQWETASEKNNQGFEVQVSADGKSFETIGSVASKNPNATSLQRYEFLDKQVGRSGLVYYRIKQTDFSGTVAFYGPKVVDFGRPFQAATVYPNPFQDHFTLELISAEETQAQVTLSDLAGKVIYENSLVMVKGKNQLLLNLADKCPAGLYLLTTKTSHQAYAIRVLKQ